jgi:hypothetical protein
MVQPYLASLIRPFNFWSSNRIKGIAYLSGMPMFTDNPMTGLQASTVSDWSSISKGKMDHLLNRQFSDAI